MDVHRMKLEVLNKELENTENKLKMGMGGTLITKVKSTLGEIDGSLEDTEELISELEDRVAEVTETEQKKNEKK